MKPDYRSALMNAWEKGTVPSPAGNSLWRVYNAAELPGLENGIKSALKCEQGFRSGYLALQEKGYAVEARFPQDAKKHEGAIVLAGRNRKINESNIIRAWNACETGATIIVAGDKTSGIAPLRKWISGKTEIAGSFSKFHAVVFWLQKLDEDWPLPELFKSVDGYTLAEGMFSSNGPDKGSRILVKHFDKRICGRVADLGAGWGYLSAELLKRSDAVSSLDLFEADHRSLEAARENLRKQDETEVSFHWCDVTAGFKKSPYDWVIMNPPFHAGRAAEPDIGKRFIQTAASTLPSGGRLLLVANRNLPYEPVLEKTFRKYEILESANGFKVIEARK